MTLSYLWNRFLKKLPGAAVQASSFEKPSKAEAGSTIVASSMGHYSYCGYNCTLINCQIGRFCSLSDNVTIGLGDHPMDWVSTSPAFYQGRDSIPKNLAALTFQQEEKTTVIGSDVWIGRNVLVKSGVVIGNGAIVAMGSVVTKDVPPYSIVGGNPAHIIRYRFAQELCVQLEASRWWELDAALLKRHAALMNDPKRFLIALENA